MTYVYSYHPQSGEFLSREVADESPLEPGVFLIPANACLIEPPAVAALQVAVYRDAAWRVVADHRGKSYWLDGQRFRIDELGVVPPEGSTPEPLPPTLAATKEALIAAVDDRIGAIYSRFTRFETEYVQREAAARAFVAGGYQGDAGVWVLAFANNAGMSAAQAADLIIGQADALRNALVQLGAQRMRKYGIAAAATAEAAQAVHDDITGQAAAIAANL